MLRIFSPINQIIIMKRLNTKVEIKYFWDSEIEIPEKHIEPLQEDAMNHITEMMKEGYTGGELITTVRFGKDIVPEEDENEGLYYTGWWSINTEIE